MRTILNLWITATTVLLLVAVGLFSIPDDAAAQTQLLPRDKGTTGLDADLAPLLDRAKENGLSVIVVTPGEQKADVEQNEPSWGEQALKIRSELRRIFSKAPELPGAIMKTLQTRSPDGSFNWLLFAIGIAIAGILAGMVLVFFTSKWFRTFFNNKFSEDVVTRAEKISYLMFRATIILINIGLAIALSVLVALILDPALDASYATIGVILAGYFAYRIFRHVIFFNLIAPDVPTHRMINLDDAAADRMQRAWRSIAMFVIIISSFFVWLALIGLPPDPLKLLVIVSLLLCVIIMAYGFIKHRREGEGIILGAGEAVNKPAWRRLLAANWHRIAIVYMITGFVVSVWRIVLNQPAPMAVIAAPIAALIGAIVIYALLLIVIDRYYGTRKRRFDERVALAMQRMREEEAARAREMAEARKAATRIDDDGLDIDDEEAIIHEVMAAKRAEEMPAFKPVFKTVFEEAAGILVLILAVAFILGAWEVNIGESGNPVTSFMDTLFVLFVGWVMYRAVIVYIDNQLSKEAEDGPEAEETDSEMGGKSSSRLGTLLPLIRNVLVAAIFVLSFMIILSNFGVDIAPLFAGAGVIGLAIGFGAQTLIRDIFSGGFFLFDDAFRKGEYIEMGDIRGTVEKISLRSFQLRHHNGPLHTIPFGEIKQLTNYSRDWVMMKLPLRLTYETDVERVRKLVKKLGQRLLEHPEVGHLFLQPLKSQGVYKMEDSAMIIRVKFMTKPGDQFVTRKVVYQAIRDLFEENNIRFANKEVTVHIADDAAKPLSDTQKTAVAAAVRRVSDDDAETMTPQPRDDGP